MPNKYALVYHYYKSNDISELNLKTFIKLGYLDDVDYYFIIASKTDTTIFQKSNIKI